jgi:hypothetical protein
MKRFTINSRFFMLSAFCFAIIITGCQKSEISDLPSDPQQLGAKKRNPGEPHLLVGDLKELQGSTVGPDQALYVTAPLDGTIYRVDPTSGVVSVFATGLPKRNPDPFFLGAGVIDVVFREETAYALVTGVGSDLGGEDIVGIYRVDGPNSNTVIADIGAWSIEHPPVPDFFVPTGFQYSFESYRDGFIVTDGHHNRVLNVTLDGGITEMISFPNDVPTGLEQRGKTIYVTQAGPIPHLPADARLMSFTSNSSTATEVATAAGLGVGLFVDVEFGLGNTLFVPTKEHRRYRTPERYWCSMRMEASAPSRTD